MLWVDIKYANLASASLEKFRVTSNNPYTANFRCPLCGDSKKDPNKTRGYFFQSGESVKFKCQNCGAPGNVPSLLKQINPGLFDEYVAECYLNKKKKPKSTVITPQKVEKNYMNYEVSPLKKLRKISQLPWNHPAKKYVENRKIPTEAHTRLYYCPKFANWTNSMIPDKLPEKMNTPRLIIPFMDRQENMFGYQGRSFDPDVEQKYRYISIMLDERKTKVFGLNKCNQNKKHYILEGPIDSLFLPNAIAMAGSDINKEAANENSVFVYDNEPRNKEIVGMIHKRIENGYKVFIWPTALQEYKDINDCVLGGIDTKALQEIIDSNTFEGLEAGLQLNNWKK